MARPGGRTRRENSPRRTVRNTKAGAGTVCTGVEEETGGAENRSEPTESRKGQKERERAGRVAKAKWGGTRETSNANGIETRTGGNKLVDQSNTPKIQAT